MHPYGCEAETSLQELFDFFTRCLQNGEWELAEACVPQLCDAGGEVSQRLRDIIKAIITYPYLLEWESVGSPHKLAWLWLQVLEKWTKEEVSVSVRRELEILLLLEELGDEVPETTLKELHQAFLTTQSEESKGSGLPRVSPETGDAQSPGIETCLEALLDQKRPRVAQALVSFLEDHPRSVNTGNHILQDTFIRYLMERVEHLGPGSEKMEGWAEEMCVVLALMPLRSERGGGGGGQLEALCEALWRARDGPLREERVLSSLLRPHCHTLLSHYCSTALRLHRDRLLRETPSIQVDLPEAEKLLLGLCCHGDRLSVWKTIYFECLSSGKHFLEQVLVTALDLVKREEFCRLEDLLKGEFQPLSRLLLLLGWTQCQSLLSAQTLLRLLHHDQALANDSVLREFANGLSSQLGVLEWCVESNPGIPKDALLGQLHTLDSHSALYVLHCLTPLAQNEEHMVLDLLNTQPKPTGADEFGGVVDGPSPMVQRNLVLYRGFCAMKYALYAMCITAHKYSGCSDCGTTQCTHQHQSTPEHQATPEAEKDQSQASTQLQDCPPLFQLYLSECQIYLEAVPAMFRLELLENIFSLLFLSSADFTFHNHQGETTSTGQTEHSEEKEGKRRKGQQEGKKRGDGREENESSSKTEVGGRGEADQSKMTKENHHQPLNFPFSASQRSHLDLGHLTAGCRGFLVDLGAMQGFLRLLRESLEGVVVVGQRSGQEEGRALAGEAEAAESLGCSVTAETFGARLQRLSKRTAEAQWRLQIIASNQDSGNVSDPPTQLQVSPAVSPASCLNGRTSRTGVRRRKRPRRQHSDIQPSTEIHNGEVSSSPSDGSGGAGRSEWEVCPCGSMGSWVVPAMLAPPESLLMACIRRGNYMEAHQVSLMFGLEGSWCFGELVFMERYREVLEELGRVEQKMETHSLSSSSSSSEGLVATAVAPAPGRSRLGSSGRSTLQAIGSAAAAGMAFYSVSDVADRLLSTPGRPVPSLEEGYWLGRCVLDPPGTGLLHTLLEELSPPAMAAFDLACCHCQLWKTSRQLLDTAERRLHSSLEGRGLRVEPNVKHAEGIRGFPAVLQQMGKILSHTASHSGNNKGPAKTESIVEDHVVASPLGCCIQEVLLCCHPVLSEEGIATRLSLAQHLEITLQTLSTATETTVDSPAAGALLTALVEQASLKPSELESHPVRSSMKQLLRSVDQLCPTEPQGAPCRPDYMRSFVDYVNTLASVLIRSLGCEDQSSEVKLGNPLLVLLQAPSQLLSHLLFDRQVSPDRVLSLLQQEGLRLSVQQVIVQRCCEALPLWDWCPEPEREPSPRREAGTGGEAGSGGDPCSGGEGGQGQGQTGPGEGVFRTASLAALLQLQTQEHMSMLGITEPQSYSPSSESEGSPSMEDLRATTPPILILSSSLSPSRPTSSSSSFLLTPSALSFLKARSPLLATLACLSVSPRGAARVQPSGWLVFRGGGRKECVLDGEQISREGENLLRDFPILRAYLGAMVQPVLGTSLGAGEDGAGGGDGGGLGAALCGKPLVVLLLSGPQGTSAQAVAMEAFQQALASRDLCRALSLLELYGQGCSQERGLRDRLLAWAALEDGEDSIGQLFRVQDPCLRARVALQALERWPLGPSLELLEFCLNNPHVEASLKGELEHRKTELDIYQRMLNLEPSLPWATWQELRTESRRDPESMFSRMLEAREFFLCAQWMALFSVSDHLRLQLQTEHLLHLLEKGQTDNAFQLLAGLSDLTLGLEVCERALDRRPGLAACHFLANYLTLHFQSQVSPARRRHIQDLHLGSKVLLTLPPNARQDYFPLLSEPLLMLEQLLMNLKVDWAEVAVRTLQNLLLGREDGFTTHDIDKLLSNYACKALDFPYAPTERSRSDSVISLQDDHCPAQDSCPSTPSRMATPPPTAGSTSVHTSSSSSSLDRGSTGRRIQRSPDQFQPPDRAPVRKDWVPDNQQHVCMVCQRERFTMFNRRHHCRRCGRLVCHACSDHKMAVEGCTEEEKRVRVCDQCYSYFHPDSDDTLEQAEVAGSPISTEGVLDSMLHLPEVTHRQFHLSTNPTDNLQLQTEFYYEQAPSASLCVAILSLHSDQTACGHQLIGHCRSLSRKLTNPEVDARLLTDVMRQLLFSAKLMFVKVGRSQDLALCDSYISKVDVLKILVTANYKYIPSLDDILETAAVTRLRNQLVEAEYYQLAVEVSTKSGLDPGGVWQAWGMSSLKAGNLTVAREKLCRCLKAPVDRNQLNLGPRLLQDIVSHLESTVRPTLAMSFSEDILWSLRELEEALCEPGGSVDWPEGGQGQGSSLYQESLYYLSSYGTHLALVSFLMRHDNMKGALQHLLSKECPEEVFLEGILQPSLERGRLGMLQGLLETLDTDLEVCSRYLLSSCQLLQRRGHFHTLYQLQQFMMDHVRAAMTCIRFFTHGVVSYVQLGDQRRWLVRAKEHLRTYLQEQQGTRTNSTNRKRSTSNSFRKKMSSSDVSRHMNTIELQLEVTRFLHHCETSSSTLALTPSVSSSTPPTLFGPSAVKIDVACKVMLGGKNIEEGFGIAYRVIQDFQLEALTVYVRAGQRLVRQRQYRAVRQLLKCVGESGTATKNDCDVIILSCVSIADKGPTDAKELECLILETKSTENKIKAYL
ncbi:zinc finger FYVE domain-containing protein 26 isoform X3 [Salvelinus alpinus]